MRYLILFSLVLAACGSSEKKPAVFGTEEQAGNAAGLCPAGYAPLPLFREGFSPLPSPDALPAGTYRLVATEAYFREEGGALQAHFFDSARPGEVVSGKRCVSELAARRIISVKFPALREFVRGATDSHVPAPAYILGERERFTFSKPFPEGPQPGGILEVLSLWSHWNIYKISESEYELRLYTYEMLGSTQVMKRMTLRFLFQPSAP